MCAPFLERRGEYVFLAHMVATECLRRSSKIFRSGHRAAHGDLFTKSLDAISRTRLLWPDSFDIGQEIGEGRIFEGAEWIQYSCVHWIDHFCDAFRVPSDDPIDPQALGILDKFLQVNSFLWIEALSLMKLIGDTIRSLEKLQTLLKVRPWLSVTEEDETNCYRKNHPVMDYKVSFWTYESS